MMGPGTDVFGLFIVARSSVVIKGVSDSMINGPFSWLQVV